MNTDNNQNSTSNPLANLIDPKNEKEDVSNIIQTIERLGTCASFAPTVNEKAHKNMMETTLFIIDSLRDYHQKLI